MKILLRRWQPWLLSALLAAVAVAGAWALLFPGDASEQYMPHAHCYLLNPQLIRLHGYSDFLIGAAYVSISATLIYLVMRARREIPFHWMMLAFATFIVACGATHFMEVWTLRTEHPPYWLAGKLKLVTAVASLVTAFMLPPLVPKILALLQDSRLSVQRKRDLETALTELGQAHERVKQLDQMKTNFFANISHELRTPITLILGPVNNLLGAKALTIEQRRELQLVKRNATLLHKLVNDLLDIARLEAGKMQVRYTRFDLARLAKLVSSFFSSSTLRTIELTVEAPGAVIIEADQDKVQGLLFNLVSNAYKFTPEHGKVRLLLSEEEDTVLLQVEDTGPGISREKREWIFERFTQADTPSARGGSGTGLGLSIVRDFVQLHRGQVWIGEAPGGGASFQIRLPKRAPAGLEVIAEPTVRPAEAADNLTAGRETARATLARFAPAREPQPSPATGLVDAPLVLVAEDHPEMRAHIVGALSGEWRVATAENGKVALDLAPNIRPDLIVTDLMMPEMSGDELLTKLRAHPILDKIPVILLTARADDEMKLRLLREGAQDFIVKPFAAEELQTRVRNLISTKLVRDMLQGELASQEQSVERLAKEVTVRARELERAKESAEAANRAKDQFLAVLSHELRTPLTPALATAMNLEMQENLEPSELRHSLQVIRRNIELEARLIDDLLDLTRISRGKLLLHMEEVDAHEAIRHAIEMCDSEIAGKASNLVLDLAAERHHLKADGARVLQVVWNLLLNAVKFTPQEGRIDVRTFNEGEKLVIELTDTGVGISPEILRKIFEPFEQAEQLPARRFGGLGLGLAVAKGLVDAHGGTISAQSAGLGHGATFRVALETVLPKPPEISAPGQAAAPGPPISLRILLLEDHDDTREVMERLLRLWGHHVTTARTVQSAMAEIERGEFDALVSDLGLPDGHGTEVMMAVRVKAPRLIGIAMSGFGMEDDLRRSREAGFVEHLTKPVATLRLRALLEQYAADLTPTA